MVLSLRFRGWSLLKQPLLLSEVVSAVFARYNPPELCPICLLCKCVYVNLGDGVGEKWTHCSLYHTPRYIHHSGLKPII